jgi:hypothetical protein
VFRVLYSSCRGIKAERGSRYENKMIDISFISEESFESVDRSSSR